MIKNLIYTIITVSGLFFTVNCQTITASKQELNDRIKDNALGISFIKAGETARIDTSTYNIKLPSSAAAQVSVSNKLFVDLPGSYGGRLYFDSPNAWIEQNKVKTDNVNSGGQNYQREYWAVYAGMGMWECVINCYTRINGKYYIVSYIQDRQLGKPGEINEGKQLKAEDLKLQALSYLQNQSNNSISEFYTLLASFQIQK